MADSATSLMRQGRILVEQLGGRWTERGGMCRCPGHDDRDPSLSVRPGRSRLLFHCFAGCDTADILRALKARGFDGGWQDVGDDAAQGCSTAASLSAAAIRLWGRARAVAGTPAEHYLSGRGLLEAPRELRFYDRAPHGPKPLTRFRPALIAAVHDQDGMVAVHRTFLARRGADLGWSADAKCALGPLGRGAVRLAEPGPRMGLAEGIETALSASALFGIPCWATLGSGRFRTVALPDGVEELLLFLDNDAGGRRAEALARSAFAGLPSVEARYPPKSGQDWNDVVRASAGMRGQA